MHEVRLGLMEGRFADIIWENAPLSTREMVRLCEEKLGWKRTTTYTVLKKTCDRGIFKMENKEVTVLISKEKFKSIQTEYIVSDSFQGSLPAFIAAFARRQKLSDKDVEELRRLIERGGDKG
mgnify:CR=1 FL=1